MCLSVSAFQLKFKKKHNKEDFGQHSHTERAYIRVRLDMKALWMPGVSSKMNKRPSFGELVVSGKRLAIDEQGYVE